ncbi:hypothetical protein YC2023_089267 [Brassica napus]
MGTIEACGVKGCFRDGRIRGLACFLFLQPVTAWHALPLSSHVLILLLLSNSSAFTISLGQCMVSFGQGLDGTDCTACTALYGRPYHTLSKLHSASSLHLLNSSSLLTYMLNSTQQLVIYPGLLAK